jgi:hypothetical protein
MSETSLSAFVLKAKAAMAEYQRLRFLGVSHEQALHQSGFFDAIVPRRERFDHKAAQAGERE